MTKDIRVHKHFLLLLTCLLSGSLLTLYGQAPTLGISGKITDDKGAPVAGVSVTVQGTTGGSTSDNEGLYKIRAATGSVIHFSAIGFIDKSVTVGTETTINITMANDEAKQLNDVVVVGYGTQKRADVTGSVASVPKSRLTQIPVQNVLQAIEGSVAGVSVTNTSSVPGANPAVLVRGQNSINANSGPYVVVDGIPLTKTGGSLNDINPNDITSIEVLKDASAVAIYGANGSQGVILITTRRGTTGKPVIRYNGYVGMDNIAHILKPRTGPEYVQKYADYMKQTGQTQVNPVPNAGELPYYNSGTTTDWVDATTQTGIIQDHNLSVSGGTQDVKYYISGEYMDQKGVILGYKYKRINVRANLDINVTSFLTVGTSMFFTNNNYDGGRANLLFGTAMSPYAPIYNPDGTYKIYPMTPELLYTNPLLGLTTDQLNRNTNVNGNGYAEIKFPGVLKGLKFRLNAGYTYIPLRTASYTGRQANDMLGTANVFSSETNSFTLENLLTYTKDWKKHHIDFTGLYSAQRRKYFEQRGTAVGFVNDQLSYNNMGAGATQTSASYGDRYALNSQMGRINYSYDSRYLLTVTARRDGSSVFGANTSKYGVFPSAAIGWNVSNENFMKDVSWINTLKLRLSYGKAGNEAIPVYRTITTDNTARSPFNGVSTIGILPGNLGNANLHWESTKSANLGIDFSIFNDRVSGSLDLYSARTYDLLLLRALPIATGYSNVYDNLGKTANKGIEITINTKNVVNGDFKWETSVNFSANKNKIVDLYGDKKNDIGNRWFIGQPISVVYDYKMQGIWQTGEDASKQDPGAKPGDLKFADVNGDHKITPDSDRVIIGQTAPKWMGGITNTFHYKNWNLNIFIQTAQGMTKNNNDLTYADESGRRNTPEEVGYWTVDNKSNTRPALSYTNPRGYGYASDASYTRIKDVTLSFIFPKRMTDKIGLGSLTLYASGRNLYTFTNWIGWDPENNYSQRGSGDWTNNYPTVRSFVFGANVSLR